MDERTLSKIGGDMCEFDLAAHLARVGAGYPPELVTRARKVLRATPLTGRLAGAAALQAYVDAGLHETGLDPERVGHVAGGNNLNNNYFVQNVRAFDQDPDSIDPLLGMVFWDTDVLGKIGELLTIKGPNYMVGNACASGNAALLCAIDLLRAGRVDTVVVSAATQELDPVGLQGWALMNALVWQSFADAPTQASRPFDARRQGFVPGEGAGAVILETLAGARARGARIHAELLGGVSTCDATRLPRPVVEGQVRVMRGALRDARVAPGAGQLHQRARHLDGPRRCRRGRGDQAGLRRPRLPHPDQRDQVHAGALPDRGGSGRAGRPARPDARTASCTRRSTSTSPSPASISTSCPTRPARTTSTSRSPTRSASAG